MLERNLANKVLECALSKGASFAEIFVEETRVSNISFLDSKTKDIVAGKEFGVGIRVFYGESAYYGYTNDATQESLLKTAEAVASAGQSKEIKRILDFTNQDIKSIHPIKIDNFSVPTNEKIAFLKEIDKSARDESKYITQVALNMMEKKQNVQIVNSEGVWTFDTRNYSRVYISTVAMDGNEMQTGGEGPGALAGYEFFQSLDPVALGKEASRVAVTMLKAGYAPSGNMPVIIDNGFGGVIFHEACGHSLETTSVAKGASVFCNKMGEKIAHEAVTAIDDGTIPNKWGSINIDDEGMPTQRTVLIENGILKSYIVDKMGGLKMGIKPTGSGRRQNYKFAPASRMRNTFIAPGKHKLEDLIASVENGIYAKKMGGGSVMPGTGNFNFSVQEGYLIENGKISKPVRGATLIGNGADTLLKISMVADNLGLAEGMCGSVSGSIPTCVGQPAIKVDDILVGGR